MYLTRFQINPQRREARKLLASPHAMHAAVLSGFATPQLADAEAGRVLWRVDHNTDHRTFLYLISPSEPDLTHLVENAGWPTLENTWQTRVYDDFLASLKDGQQWAFRLTANPVRNGRPPGERFADTTTKRYGHVTVQQQRAWLLERAERAGFQITVGALEEPDVIVHSRSTQTFRRGGSRVTLRIATYDGQLEVTDATALRRTLVRGLGHAKAYGCGLLTLAPLR